VKDYEQYLLVNIANEVGRWEVTDEQFKQSYEAAVQQIRNTGIRCPLVIDAAGWGRGENYLLNNARYLLDADPERNLIFSWHPWDPAGYKERPGSKQRINRAIDRSIEMDICFILAEFSRCELPFNCDRAPLLWEYMIEYATKKEIGWLVWSWYCCGREPDVHSITSDGIFGNWHNEPWGRKVTVDWQYSIKNTAVKPGFITEGDCLGTNAGNTKEDI
jgi:mannan endo-1,4-beta-mannosidase